MDNDKFSPGQSEQFPDALPPEDASLARALHTVYQSEADLHKRSLERVRARLAQEEALKNVSLPTSGEPLKGKIMHVKQEVIEDKSASWGKNFAPTRSLIKKPDSFVWTVGFSLVAAVAVITILSFAFSANVLHSVQTLTGALGQMNQSQIISHEKQVCTFTTSHQVGNQMPNLDWSTQGQVVAASDNYVQVVSAHDCQMAFSQPLQKNYTVHWSPDGSKVVVASTNHTLDVFDSQGHSLLHRTFSQLGTDSVVDVFWSSDSTQLIFFSESDKGNSISESIKSVNVSGSSNITTLMTLPTNYVPVIFSPNGKFFITAHMNAANTKDFDFWDLKQKKQVSTLLSPIPDSRGMVVLSPDGSQVAIVENKQIEIYATADGRRINSFHAAPMSSPGSINLAWSPDGRYLAEGTNAITIYDLQANKVVATFGQVDAHYTITTPAWAPDGKGLVFVTELINHSSPEDLVQVWALS